jgi:phosphate transport system substrate-binding protein
MPHTRFALAATILLAGIAPACAGTLTIPGTGDGLDMLRHVATLYSEQNPDTVVLVPPSVGSGGGKTAVIQDKAVLGRIAVPLNASDEAFGLVAVPIVRVPTAFFAHPGIKVSNLTAEQAGDIFAGKIKNWSEVGGPDLRIRVVRREEADSTLQVLRATMRGWKDLIFTERSKTAVTTQEAFESVREYEGAIGFGPYSKGIDEEFTLIKVDGHHPISAEYPSYTTIRLIFKRDKLTPEGKNFVTFARSPKAGAIYASYGGIPENFGDIGLVK